MKIFAHVQENHLNPSAINELKDLEDKSKEVFKLKEKSRYRIG